MSQNSISSSSSHLAYCNQQGIQLRFLCPYDIAEVKRLCQDWFPIEYPESWYEDITTNPKFYSVAAVINAQIIGMLVCEVKPRTRCNREDGSILAGQFPPSSQVAYILSLGVVQEYRRNGIASLLVDHLIAYLTSPDNIKCKCIYLHVLTTNQAGINFYERRHFRMHNFLPYYYSIQGMPRDGYCYVLYINGGQPPWTILDYLKLWSEKVLKQDPCSYPRRLLYSAHACLYRLVTVCAHKIQGGYS